MAEVRHHLLQYLVDHEVAEIFGNPGSSEVPLLDELAVDDRVAYRLVLHESIAIAMADAYAQTRGSWGFASVHATPGVLNILGGLFLAQAHHSPVVVIAGQQDSRLLLNRPFLASDVVREARQYVKFAWQAERAEDVVPAVRRAMQTAITPPRGPALVSIPKDLYGQHTPGNDEVVPQVTVPPLPDPPPEAIAKAVRMILEARYPVIMSGNGVGAAGAGAVRAVVRFAELVGGPVHSEHNATNMHFPNDHPQYLGGNAHGTASMVPWLEDADLLVAIGCDLFMEDRVLPRPLVPPGCPVIQIDVDPLELARNRSVAVAIHADLERTVLGLEEELGRLMDDDRRHRAAERRREVDRRRRRMDEERAAQLERAWDSVPIRAPRLYRELRAAMDDDAIMVDEAVNTASYLHEYFQFTEPGTLLSSKQSWLGWGWGAALGVQLARPDRQVVAVLGDGSALYLPQALWTAREYGIPITAVILNNGGYMAVQNHLRNYAGRAVESGNFVGTQIAHVDHVGLARSFGVSGERIAEPSELGDALRRALSSREPRVVEVVLDPDDAGFGRAPIPRRTDVPNAP